MKQATTLFLFATIGFVLAAQVDTQYSTMMSSQVEGSEDQQWEAMYDEDFVRAQVEGEIERAIMDEEWWNFLPQKTRDALRPILNTTGTIGNQLFDMMQANINRQMKDLTGDRLGLLGLIPEELRSVASPFTRILADPSSKLVDFLQEQVNKGFRNFAQTEASVETMSEDEKVVV